jgi:hypothetical protein
MHLWQSLSSAGILRIMSVASRLLLALLLVMTGCLAGILLMTEIGILPAVRSMPLESFARYWASLDAQMALRMPTYARSELLLYVVTIISMWRLRRRPLFWMVCLCLLMSARETIFTVKRQLPINRELQHIVATGSFADDAILSELREEMLHNFAIRMALAGGSFSILCLSVLFLRTDVIPSS